jgi:hypothetical protein
MPIGVVISKKIVYTVSRNGAQRHLFAQTCIELMQKHESHIIKIDTVSTQLIDAVFNYAPCARTLDVSLAF